MGGLGAGLLLAETVVRVGFPEQAVPRADHEEHQYFCRFDPALGWSGKPYARGTFSSTDYRTLVEQNSDGMRDDEFTARQSLDPKRILLLGDSFVWGLGVDGSEIVDRRMEALLGRGWEVLNTGVSGYGTDQEYLYYHERGRLLEAGTVVLFLFTDNDFEDIASSNRHQHEKPIFLVDPGQGRPQLSLKNVPVPEHVPSAPSSPTRAVLRWLGQHSYLYGFVLTRLDLWDKFEPLSVSDSPMTWRHPDEGYTEIVMALLLVKLNEEVRAEGARLVVVIVPPRRALNALGADKRERHLSYASYVTEVGRRAGFSVTDLLPELDRAASGGQLPYYIHDIHWNPLGHEIAAAAAVQALSP